MEVPPPLLAGTVEMEKLAEAVEHLAIVDHIFLVQYQAEMEETVEFMEVEAVVEAEME